MILDPNSLILLLAAIAIVESGVDRYAYKAKENAAGIYQIRPIYLADVNRITNRNYILSDRYDIKKASEMVIAYLNYYGRHYEKQTGKPATLEVLARCHNGGENGWRKKATETYWQKVKAVLCAKK